MPVVISNSPKGGRSQTTRPRPSTGGSRSTSSGGADKRMPVVIAVVVVCLLIAVFAIYRTVSGTGGVNEAENRSAIEKNPREGSLAQGGSAPEAPPAPAAGLPLPKGKGGAR